MINFFRILKTCFLVLTGLILLTLNSCSKKDQEATIKQKGNRQFAVHITQSETNSYDTEFQRVKSVGAVVVPITISWNAIETKSGFDFSLLSIIDSYYPTNDTKVSINITPMAAISRALPDDLQSTAFNDPVVISRFKSLLDSIYKKLPTTKINNFIVGVEVDIYLNNHPDEWAAYHSFYDSAIVHIKKLWGSTMPVGVETTWSTAAFDLDHNVVTLNKNSDMMVLSYYPNNADYTVKPPTIVHSDIETIIALYPSMPIFIVECGYQTSASCNSSDSMQQQFITEMFKLWDDYDTKINFVGFLWLTDLSDTLTDQYVIQYGQSASPNVNAFKGYLQTTGLRTYPGAGADKLGFTQLKLELSRRGF